MAEHPITSSAVDPVVAAFLRLVERRAADPVISAPDGHISFQELDAFSRRVAEHVSRLNLTPGTIVGLSAPNGPAFLAGFLALRRVRLVPILLDPLAPTEERRRVTEALGAGAALTFSRAWPSSTETYQVEQVPGAAYIAPEGVAVVKLTSGSTGTARGVAATAENILADEDALARSMGFRDSDRLLIAIPLSHSYGFTTLALSALVRGLPLVLGSGRGPFAALNAGAALGATVFPTVPAYVGSMLKLSIPPPLPSTVRLVLSAGAMLPRSTAEQFRQCYGTPIHVFYGSTECGGICYDQDGLAAERGTVGTPVDGVHVSLSCVDGIHGEGLVRIQSPAVAPTYLPVADRRLAGGTFETTDVATWNNGELQLKRRVDCVINVRGFKVDPAEVEGILLMLGGVIDAAVMGVPSPGGDGEIIRAFVACAPGTLNYSQVTAWCRPRLAEHKVPRGIVFVDCIPRTSRGKVDRAALLGGCLANFRN